jgi:hypothetical protein
LKTHDTRLQIGATLLALSALLASPTSAHCYAGQHCTPDPLNLHHGGAGVPPEVKEVAGALRNIAGQASAGAVAGVFTVVEIETLEVPAGPAGRAAFVPKIELAKIDPPKNAAAAAQLTAWPLSPAAFARQALAVQTPENIALVKQGVLDSSRTLLDVAASDKMVTASTATASARMLAHHLAVSSEALAQLRQYDAIIGKTRELKGSTRVTAALWTDMEKLSRYSQNILQRGAVDK